MVYNYKICLLLRCFSAFNYVAGDTVHTVIIAVMLYSYKSCLLLHYFGALYSACCCNTLQLLKLLAAEVALVEHK